MTHKTKIINKDWLTHDVLRLRLEKPPSFSFVAGQAIDVAIDNENMKEGPAPFTLTGLNSDPYLELIMKVYTDHSGITQGISWQREGETLIISDAWISFKNMGAGVFIAGGTGITPFIAILRQLKVEGKINGSTLFFSNKTEKDIFLYDELNQMLGKGLKTVLTREKKKNHLYGRINKEFLKNHITNFRQPFYVCGPGSFTAQISDQLLELGFDKNKVITSY